MPIIGSHLYRPVLLTSCPETTEVISRAAISGIISSPAWVALRAGHHLQVGRQVGQRAEHRDAQ